MLAIASIAVCSGGCAYIPDNAIATDVVMPSTMTRFH